MKLRKVPTHNVVGGPKSCAFIYISIISSLSNLNPGRGLLRQITAIKSGPIQSFQFQNAGMSYIIIYRTIYYQNLEGVMQSSALKIMRAQ